MTSAKLGRLISSILTSFFILGTAFILFKGRRARKALIPLKLADWIGKKSNIQEITTMKSRIFQPSRKYVFLESKKP